MGVQRLYREIVKQIVELIDSGEYPTGSRLPPERELAERFGVSRPTIREAVIALEAIGRVAVKTGSGMYVTENTSDGMFTSSRTSPFELMEARVLVESEAAALAALLITEDQLAELAQSLEDMARENTMNEFGIDQADRNFHRIISEATNNAVLSSLIKELWDAQDHQEHIKSAHHAVCADEPELRIAEHRAIYDALAKHNPLSARMAMRHHFKRAIDALHHATEEEAVEKVRRRLSQTRERFSVDRLLDSTRNGLKPS